MNKTKSFFSNSLLFGIIFLVLSCTKENEDLIIPKTITDIDGNVYHTVVIGSQLWMAENLKVSHYRNGDPIDTKWHYELDSNLTGSYCYYNNDTSYNKIYGKLYNWGAVGDKRGLCPEGWHVPSDVEWNILIMYLGGYFNAAGKLIDRDTLYWNGKIPFATNESGFTALPGGYFMRNFYYIGYVARFWSSTEWEAYNAIFYELSGSTIVEFNPNSKDAGFSIRCLKN